MISPPCRDCAQAVLHCDLFEEHPSLRTCQSYQSHLQMTIVSVIVTAIIVITIVIITIIIISIIIVSTMMTINSPKMATTLLAAIVTSEIYLPADKFCFNLITPRAEKESNDES